MSSTRTRPPGEDRAPESYLSAPELAGININLPTIAQVARIRPEKERRAMLWLGNLAANWPRIALVWERRGLTPPLNAIGRITADQLASELGLTARDIRAALRDPAEDRTRFVAAVQTLRTRFEAALPPLAPTGPAMTVKEAFNYLGTMKKIGAVDCPCCPIHGRRMPLYGEWYRCPVEGCTDKLHV